MIDLPLALKSHVKQDVTTLAYCWTIICTDGTLFGFTDHDQAINVLGVVHDPQTGFNATAAESELGLAIATMDLEGALRSDKISGDDLRNGKFDDAEVKTSLVNWSDPSQLVLLRKSRIGKIEISGGAFKVELQSVTQSLDKKRGRVVRRNCDAELGDNRCKKLVTTGAYQAVGIVNSVINATDFYATGLQSFETKWFEGGTIEWLSGANINVISSIAQHEKSSANTSVSVWLPTNQTIAVGDSFRITSGCDKQFKTCKDKFANQLNFRGFPHLPGNDAVYTYVDGNGIFDGMPLVP
jgi:uncharacterized phage protein (TIGR02218 family)